MAARKDKPRTAPAATGIIDPAALFTIEELRRRTRLGDWALRQMRREGLRVLRCHGRAFVLGRDFIEFVQAADGRSKGLLQENREGV